MGIKSDLTGETFGRWTVVERDTVHPGTRNSYWVCKCQCGTTKVLSRSSLVSGRSKSCGCWESPNRKGVNKTHGMSDSRIYSLWLKMRARCVHPSYRSAESYYLKGIKVCDEWNNDFMAFYNWAIANGYNDNLSIDRIDNSKGYSPENCRWIPLEEQSRNRTNTVHIEYNGEDWCLRTLCVEIGFPYKTAHRRYMKAKAAGKPATADVLFAPIHTEKIARRYRK